jgi:hypothetical protein
MCGTRHHVKQNKPDSERQILRVFSHMQNLDLNKKEKRKKKKKDISKTGHNHFGGPSVGGRVKREWRGRILLKHIVCTYENVMIKPIKNL